jgi:hypothetical protein
MKGKLRTSRGLPRPMRVGTAKASRISRESAKSGCAREWGGWGRLSDDGPGQHNPVRSEGPWGKAQDRLHGSAHKHIVPDTEQGMHGESREHERRMVNQSTGKASSDNPALKPHRGNPPYAILGEAMETSASFVSSRQGCESYEVKVLVPPIACSRADSMSDACEGNNARSARM